MKYKVIRVLAVFVVLVMLSLVGVLEVSADTTEEVPTNIGSYNQTSVVGVDAVQAVDETIAGANDTDYDYIYQGGAPPETERVTFTSTTSASGTINSVTINFRIRESGDLHSSRFTPFFRIGGIDYYGTEIDADADYTWENHIEVFANDPSTTAPWASAAAVAAAEFGIRLYSDEGAEKTTALCSQISRTTNYTPAAGWTGTVNGTATPASYNGTTINDIAQINGTP